MAKSKIIIKTAKNKEPYVVVKAPNNKVLTTSETYKTMAGAKNLVQAFKKALKDSVVIDQTKKSK